MHCSGNAILSGVNISGMALAIDVSTRGEAQLSNCIVSDTMWECVVFREGGTGSLDDCVVSGSQHSHGLCVHGAGSSAKVARSDFLRNGDSGPSASSGGSLTADGCKSSDNRVAGYKVTRCLARAADYTCRDVPATETRGVAKLVNRGTCKPTK